MPKLLTQGVSLEPKNGRQLIGIVAGFKSERWPVIDRNAGRLQLGIRKLASNSVAICTCGVLGRRMIEHELLDVRNFRISLTAAGQGGCFIPNGDGVPGRGEAGDVLPMVRLNGLALPGPSTCRAMKPRWWESIARIASVNTISPICPATPRSRLSPARSRRAGSANKRISNSRKNWASITSKDDPGPDCTAMP